MDFKKESILGRCFVVVIWVQFWILFVMSRQAIIDAPGALQHIIVRGIEPRMISKNDLDRDDFIDRFGNLLQGMERLPISGLLWPLISYLALRS